MEAVRVEIVAAGYRLFAGALLVAVATTRHDRGLNRAGAVVYEPMPRADWTIHWTSPAMSADLALAVLAALPREA